MNLWRADNFAAMIRGAIIALIALPAPASAVAQVIDSVYVFADLPVGQYTSASANALVWRLLSSNAEHVVLKGGEMDTVREGMAHYRSVPHKSGAIPGLRYLAMAFTNGRPTAMGLTTDLDRMINFTSRKEYRISSMSEHLKVRAVLLELMLAR